MAVFSPPAVLQQVLRNSEWAGAGALCVSIGRSQGAYRARAARRWARTHWDALKWRPGSMPRSNGTASCVTALIRRSTFRDSRHVPQKDLQKAMGCLLCKTCLERETGMAAPTPPCPPPRPSPRHLEAGTQTEDNRPPVDARKGQNLYNFGLFSHNPVPQRTSGKGIPSYALRMDSRQ